MSQDALAEQLGISRQAVSKWETGEADPDIVYVMQMCEIFGYTREEFDRMGWHELVGLPCEEEQTGINALKEGISDEFCEEKSLHRKNGDDAITEVHFRLVTKEDGTPDYLVVTVEEGYVLGISRTVFHLQVVSHIALDDSLLYSSTLGVEC